VVDHVSASENRSAGGRAGRVGVIVEQRQPGAGEPVDMRRWNLRGAVQRDVLCSNRKNNLSKTSTALD
jgi:hypothetical protein